MRGRCGFGRRCLNRIILSRGNWQFGGHRVWRMNAALGRSRQEILQRNFALAENIPNRDQMVLTRDFQMTIHQFSTFVQ